MLRKIYYLHKNSPKRVHELKEFARIFKKIMQKPSKSTGTCWIEHRVRAMEIIFANYGIFVAHTESLSQTDIYKL